MGLQNQIVPPGVQAALRLVKAGASRTHKNPCAGFYVNCAASRPLRTLPPPQRRRTAAPATSPI